MRAMQIHRVVDLSINSTPLTLVDLLLPEAQESQVLIKVNACGVCHTELDEIEGRTPPSHLPMIPGHEADKEWLNRLDCATHLWQEKEIKSVANVTRADVAAFLDLAAKIPLRPEVQVYPLEEANTALMELKQRKIRGAKVLVL